MLENDYAETLETVTTDAGTLRVQLVPDWHAETPDHDGQAPVLCILDGRGHPAVRQEVGDDVHDGIVTALERWGSGELFERYVRAFHGTSKITYFCSYSDRSSPTWVALDTAEWREKHGVTPGSLVEEDIAGDFRHYVDGDVWGYAVEELREWACLTEGRHADRRETWETVDSCSGFYGREYAEQAAREALEEAAGAAPVTCDGCSDESEAGWGDSAFCLDCHASGRATEGTVCEEHERTYVDECPLHD